MIEFVNRNLEKTQPSYFYFVEEFVTTFKMDEGENDSFSHIQKFDGKDLLKCKTDSEKYYWQRLFICQSHECNYVGNQIPWGQKRNM